MRNNWPTATAGVAPQYCFCPKVPVKGGKKREKWKTLEEGRSWKVMAWGGDATASGRCGEAVTVGRADDGSEEWDHFRSGLHWMIWTISVRQGVLILS